MRIFMIALAVIAAASAASISSEYLPPVTDNSLPSQEVAAESETPVEIPKESAALAEDGYRYKTVRRLKYRQRRDVSELPSNEYLPPTEKSEDSTDDIVIDTPVANPKESAALAEDGYRYKTVRRLKYRQRRDVSELPSNEYLPPAEKTEEVVVEVEAPIEAPQESAALADDGYQYRTVRRLKFRQRRDVSELPSNEYLPPAEKTEEVAVEESAPVVDGYNYKTEESAPKESAALAEDGYRYKTVRRLKYRQRRDVNELPSNEYLPPAEKSEETHAEVAQTESSAPVEEGYNYKTEESVPKESAALAEDGYRYKTVRRLKYRQRRDVSELPSSEYLPPAEKTEEVVVEVEAPVEAPQESAALADDGYQYKTVRRLKYRQRRDVNELPSNEYLPPAEKSEEAAAEVEVPAEASQESAALAEDGYQYKTVRRLKYRQRRDVSELPSSEYLPPSAKSQETHAEVAQTESPAPVEEGYNYKTEESAPKESAALAEDGYRYKTVRRLKYRQRRDVNELPSNEYLPPAEKSEVTAEEAAPVEEGYNYKTEESAPKESAALADDGYRYKTVRRLKYRQRRDVNELPSNEYLPPTEKSDEIVAEAEAPVEAPQESAALAEDGYQYKTVRRLKYRQRRDVSELPSSEYLPPSEKSQEAQAEVTPTESSAPVEEGYNYKTEESAPKESAALADDGYHYKTVRRLKYRQRRDVSELPSNEYLPPAGKSSEDTEDQEIAVQNPEETTVVASDGYQYKTVRRLKYRRH